MADIVDPATRSRMMASVRAKDTGPELAIRLGLHVRGFRYRLHVRDLPGHPDLVFARHRAVVFVHGCFWHGHDCPLFRLPKTRTAFWETKIGRNRMRDEAVRGQMVTLGWRHLTVWECAMRGAGKLDRDELLERVAAWLRSESSAHQIGGGVNAGG